MLFQCWRVLFLLFLAHIVCLYHFWDIRPYSSSWVFLFAGSFVKVLPLSTWRMVPSILWWGQPRCLYLWWDFSYIVWFRVVFLFSRSIHFLKISYHIACLDASTSNIPNYLSVSFSWFGSSIPTVICRFLLFIISITHFSMPDSIPFSSWGQFCSPIFHDFLDISLWLLRIFCTFWNSLSSSFVKPYGLPFFVVNPYHMYVFFNLILFSLRMYWSMYCRSPGPLVPLQHPFGLLGNSLLLVSEL